MEYTGKEEKGEEVFIRYGKKENGKKHPNEDTPFLEK